MLKQIAEITGFAFRENDPVLVQLLTRISDKLPAGIQESSKNFKAEVQKAEAAVNAEGNMAIVSLVKAILAPVPEKVLKIKSSPKGARIKIAATNGVRYSFGPIWNASVAKGKGIALAEPNRSKLNHQALMAGIQNPEAMEIQALAAAIAATF